MRGNKCAENQGNHPAGDVKVLVDPMLRGLVIEAVDVVDVDRNIGIREVCARRWGYAIANKDQNPCECCPCRQSAFVISQSAQRPQ